MSKTLKEIKIKFTKEMGEIFKRKSGPQIRPISRTKEREQWIKEWREEENETSD